MLKRASTRAHGVITALLLGGALLAMPPVAAASVSWSGPDQIDPQAAGVALDRVACPSTSQCTTVDARGQAVTFNPQSPHGPASVMVSSHTLSGVACPSSTQCTAVDIDGAETTFNPQSSAGASPTQIDPGGIPLGIACPSASQCTLVDDNGQAVTFNPQSGQQVASAAVDPGRVLIGVDCPGGSLTKCAAVDSSGGAVLFNPQAPSSQPPTQVDSTANASPTALACRPTKCAVVDNAGTGTTFGTQGAQPNPEGSGPIDQTSAGVTTLSGVSCPSDNECVAVDVHGGEVTFSPSSPQNASSAPVDGHTNLSSLSCPSSGQCTAVDVGGTEVTFTPGSSAAPSIARIDSGVSGVFGVSCPGATQCTAVDNGGQEVTFNPQSPGSPAPRTVDGGHALFSVACPSAGQCTAVDDAGRAVTFNPLAPGSPAAAAVDLGHGLPAVACPSSTQCTAIDDAGAEVTFDPLQPGRPTPRAMDRVPDAALACPAATQCTTVDASGDEVTFNPRVPTQASAESIDGSSQLTAVACRTITDCVAVDQAGVAVEGDPRGVLAWTAHQVSSNPLADVACPSAVQCSAIDGPGNAFVGSGGPLPPVPGAGSAPTLKGLAQQGQRLTEVHARWSHAPTSYTYQWQRCNSAGRKCAPIAGATASTYRLTRADVGHRVRVQEMAWNISGAGRSSGSRPSSIVGGLILVSQASLSGVSTRAPRLALGLRCARGTPRMTRITILLPSGLTAHGTHGLAVRSRGKTISYAAAIRRRVVGAVVRQPVSVITALVGSPPLSAGPQLVHRARSPHPRRLQLIVVVTQRGGGTTRVSLSLLPK